MARIPYYDPATKDADFNEFVGKVGGLNIFRMLAHSERTARGFVRLGNALLYKGILDPVLREIAIIRVGRHSRAAYEVFQHERIGLKAGMTPAMVAALREGGEEPFDATQRLVIRFTDEIVKDVKASDATFAAVNAAIGHEATVELVIAIGYYMMVSRFLETMGVDGEAGQAEWTKTGKI
ncbi:MAG: carboxymuconolactone decarboxylase family protein [Rhodospirillales bacterium]|nr:carboxymuconolactone decarboxylase family protein [Rhodospirillales bacterium]QQS13555.1 MAG: carboxymuconolactone decarboxylase family protein [Rhodospirillales bacterium]